MKNYLGKKMQAMGVKILFWDHNKERAFEWAETIIDDETDHMIAGLAFHWYSGDHFEALQMILQQLM